jgi:hypothetical protein
LAEEKDFDDATVKHTQSSRAGPQDIFGLKHQINANAAPFEKSIAKM